MPLKIIIAGAGIAGVCASIALRQAGHEVQIFERSKFASEVGAALVISPNGARVLSRLGFSFEAADAVRLAQWKVVRGDNLDTLDDVAFPSTQEKFGSSVQAVHRVDLHEQLLRLATSEEGTGQPVQLHLASEVVGATVEGSIELQDGSKHTADLIVGADGLHSVLRNAVLGEDSTEEEPTGLSAFRYLIDTKVLKESPALAATLAKKGSGATRLIDPDKTEKERHIMWYACRGGQVQNFVGIHHTRNIEGDDSEVTKNAMLGEFHHYAPEILEIMNRSSNVKCWPLFSHKPIDTWFKGRIVLIGDAAHPMLPFGGQGSNCAIEDSGGLGYLLQGVEDPASVPGRLQLFQTARKSRVAQVQILSSTLPGNEKKAEAQWMQYADPPGLKMPASLAERTLHDYSFDVYAKCDEVLDQA